MHHLIACQFWGYIFLIFIFNLILIFLSLFGLHGNYDWQQGQQQSIVRLKPPRSHATERHTTYLSHVVIKFMKSVSNLTAKTSMLSGLKIWIPACPLDKQLPDFACPGQVLDYKVLLLFLFSWQITCLSMHPCPLGKCE